MSHIYYRKRAKQPPTVETLSPEQLLVKRDEHRRAQLFAWGSGTTPWVTYTLMLINSVSFSVTSLLAYQEHVYLSFWGWVWIWNAGSFPLFSHLGVSGSAQLSFGQPWRLVTYQFLHSGFLHLFLNMSSLLLYGACVERIYGRRAFLLLYASGGIVAGIGGTLLLATDPTVLPGVGASGAIMALVGAVVIIDLKTYRAEARSLVWQVTRTILLYGVLSLVGNWGAHLAGLAWGMLCGFLFLSLLIPVVEASSMDHDQTPGQEQHRTSRFSTAPGGPRHVRSRESHQLGAGLPTRRRP